MKTIKQTALVCAYHFGRWRKNKRIVLAFLLAGIMSFLLTEKVVAFSLEKGTTVQMFEPFIWVFGDGTSILLMALLLILLFADMPFLDGSVPYYLIRIKVRVWVAGQLCYLVLSVFLFTTYILGITVLFSAHNAFSGNIWSHTAAILGYSSYDEILVIPAALKTFEMSKPFACTAVIFLLLLLYSLVSALLMFWVTISWGKVRGIAAVFGFHLFGLLLTPDLFKELFHLEERTFYWANVICGWLSPLRQVTYPQHNFGYDMLPRLNDTGFIFGAAAFLLVLGVFWSMKKYNFYFGGSEEIS